MKNITEKDAVRSLVNTAVEAYAEGFKARHESEVDNPEGIINMKVHNVFIEALGKDVQYYAALVRSLDSSLGNMLEGLAVNLAKLSFEVRKNVEGPLSAGQTNKIAVLLEKYKRHEIKPSPKDYATLRDDNKNNTIIKRHDSDYYLIDKANNNHYLIELKIGGDLDNKKARSEKEAILEQYAILSNSLSEKDKVQIFFATAYNRFGDDKPWKQERVRQFFADEELLIGKDFWNFICQSEHGYNMVLDSYRDCAYLIKDALNSIKKTYLG